MHDRIRTAILGALLVMTVAAAPAGVQTRDFRIETDQTNSNLNDGTFAMPHRVKFFRPGTDVVGDRAKGNYKLGTVTISGHVVLHDDGQSGEAQRAGGPVNGGPSTLNCDELQVDSKRKIYVATGNVMYLQGTRHATAKNGRLNEADHTLELSGNVQLGDGDQTLTAEFVHYDTLTKNVSTSGNPVTFSGPAAAAGQGTTSTLPTPAATALPTAKATPKPK